MIMKIVKTIGLVVLMLPMGSLQKNYPINGSINGIAELFNSKLRAIWAKNEKAIV